MTDQSVGKGEVRQLIPKFSVKKPYTVFVAMILVLILGAISFLNLSTDLLPSLELPYVVVMTSYPGASPEEVESIVTRPIEQLTATINNIKNVSSISHENQSVVILEFTNDVNMDSAIIEINGNLDLIKGAWGDNVGSPMILRLNPDMLPIMVSSVDIEGKDLKETTKWVNDVLMPQFEGVTGVASVSGEGLLEERVDIIINQEKIDTLNKEILDKTDKTLSEAEDEILNGLDEINKGLTTLKEERSTQNKQLDEGISAIQKGKEQLLLAESEINNGINALRDNLDSINLGIRELESKLSDINSLITASVLGGGLGGQGDSEQNTQMLQLAKQELEEKLAELNSTKTVLSDNLKELEKSKDDLNNKKLELFSQEQQINQGKILLKTEFDKLEAELSNAKRQLEEGYVEFEKAREQAFNQANLDSIITKSMISGILSAQNFSMPAGYISDQDVDYLVKVGDRLASVEEMKSLLLFDTGEDAIGKIYLTDVADVNLLDNSSETYAKVNGNDAVILTMQKQSNYSTSDVSKNIRDKISDITSEYPDVNITTLMDQGVYIDIVIDSVLNNILYGAVLAILILIVFLKDIKPTIIIALSIPISIIFAMAMMYFSGVTINIISMAGLALGVGMLVDNSIVTIENIYRLRNEGMSPGRAAVIGAKEISGAITASTVTTASVFLPIVFTTGISRDLFTDMGLTIAYSLFASLIVALTLVPAMSASMLKNTKEKKYPLLNKLLTSYEVILRWTLRYKFVVMIFVIGLLGLSGYLAYSMGTQFIPDMEAPQISGNIVFDEEISPEEMEVKADEAVVRISEIPGVDTVGVFRGGSFGGFGGSGNRGSQISMYIILEENSGIKNADIMVAVEEAGSEIGVQISVDNRNIDMAALGGSGIEVLVKGRDLNTIRELAYEVTDILNELDGTSDVSSGLDRQGVEIKVTVNKEKAMENSLTVAQIYSQISSIAGTNRTATTISTRDSDLPVIVIEGKYEEFSRDDLANLELTTQNNSGVLLRDIAAITEEEGLRSIRRDNQLRYLSVTASIAEGYNIGLVGRVLQERIDEMEIPIGYTVEIGGEQELINNSLRDLIYMTLLAIVFIYLIMVAQFQSLLSPFIVMFTIPLAFTGGLLTLFLTGNPISLIAMLGFLVLTGVVVNNGIVFVDYTNQLRDRGIDKKEALVLAGKTRMRPILMTAITTILGLSALTFGMGMGAEVLQPLAIVASGGLAYATVLTLFVVPVMYDLLHKNKMRRVALMEEELHDI